MCLCVGYDTYRVCINCVLCGTLTKRNELPRQKVYLIYHNKIRQYFSVFCISWKLGCNRPALKSSSRLAVECVTSNHKRHNTD